MPHFSKLLLLLSHVQAETSVPMLSWAVGMSAGMLVFHRHFSCQPPPCSGHPGSSLPCLCPQPSLASQTSCSLHGFFSPPRCCSYLLLSQPDAPRFSLLFCSTKLEISHAMMSRDTVVIFYNWCFLFYTCFDVKYPVPEAGVELGGTVHA